MPALNYQKQFAPKVKDGTKRQTIRARRKRPFKRGDTLYHYTGMRTKSCRKLRESICAMAVDIRITKKGLQLPKILDLFEWNADAVARADGFADFYEMFAWFKKTHGLPFKGQLIRW